MPYIKILIHTVWAIKDRKPLMDKPAKDAICNHIREYAKSKNIFVLNVNGWSDHLHCILSLSSDQNVAAIMNLIKGESLFGPIETLLLQRNLVGKMIILQCRLANRVSMR